MKKSFSNYLLNIFFVLLFSSTFYCCNNKSENKSQKENDTSKVFRISDLQSHEWKAPDTNSIPDNEEGHLIRYGRELIKDTRNYLGPEGTIKHLSNGMNCNNCHLDAGTKLFANNFSAVYSIYPKFRARSGTVEHLEKRINDCMERSLNGSKLDSTSREMRAMVAYINWVGKDVKKGVAPNGAAVVDIPFLNRPADPEKGKNDFQKYCVSCHGNDGQGKSDSANPSLIYPPLWGTHSFNTAAGLYRLSRLAGFIKSNMPNLVSSYEKPTLSDEEAWDIAAFVTSMQRPEKKFRSDWPDISKKPFDHPFGPYTDEFSELQHKFGPFPEIIYASKKK